MLRTAIFSTFALGYHHFQVLELFHFPKKPPGPPFLLLSALAPRRVSVDLPGLDLCFSRSDNSIFLCQILFQGSSHRVHVIHVFVLQNHSTTTLVITHTPGVGEVPWPGKQHHLAHSGRLPHPTPVQHREQEKAHKQGAVYVS